MSQFRKDAADLGARVVEMYAHVDGRNHSSNSSGTPVPGSALATT
jgi:hypothetical protein